MNLIEKKIIIDKTRQWILDVVIGCNFCPFAAREIKRNSIYYEVLNDVTIEHVLHSTIDMFYYLDKNEEKETSLLILNNCFENFNDYLDLLEFVDQLLIEHKYDGIYQVASFHPQYLFEGSNNDDPANYTNRSPYAMLHFLREDSISKAIDSYENIDEIPQKNIAFTHKKGLQYMINLLGIE
jgi:hypothetical protein